MSALELTATEEAIAGHAVQRQIAELRDLGIDVEVLHDAGYLAVVRINGDAGPVEMTIDPLHLQQRLRNARMN